MSEVSNPSNASAMSSEQLLSQFAASHSEPAFRELIQRHLALVYNTALRVTNGDNHLAEDISQIVFTDLATKAGQLPRNTIIAGWLHQHTWFTASKMIRTERRRLSREQQSIAMHASQAEPNEIDPHVAPILDEALTALKPEDRNALVLRFFERADFNRVGQLLGVSDDAAQKRVTRALEKLRGILTARGVTISTTALAAALSAQAATLPLTLAQTVSTAALAGAASSATALTFLSGAKLKVATAAALIAAVSAPLFLQHQSISRLRAENQSLQSRLARLDQLRADNDKLRSESLSPDDLQKLNKDLLELQRLRGEVTLLRGQAAAATNLSAKSQNDDEDPAAEPEPLQIMIQAQAAEMTAARMREVLTELGLQQRLFPLLLDAEKAAALQELLKTSEGIKLLSAPRVTTLEGRQARISVEDHMALPDGKTLPLGFIVDTVAKVEPDRASVNLTVKVNVTEFVGWEDQAEPVPRLRTRQAEHEAVVLRPGQVLLTGSSVAPTPGDPAEPMFQLYCLTPTVINPRGEPVHKTEDPNAIN